MPEQFIIRPSRTFALLLISVHVLAMISVNLTSLAVWVRVGLSVLLLISLLSRLYLNAFLLARISWRSFSLKQKQLLVRTRGGDALSGVITHPTVVMSRCVVLCAKLDGHGFPVCQVIFFDAMNTAAFRELCVRLRFA